MFQCLRVLPKHFSTLDMVVGSLKTAEIPSMFAFYESHIGAGYFAGPYQIESL